MSRVPRTKPKLTRGGTQYLLQWPVVLFISLIIGVEFLFYVLLRFWVWALEAVVGVVQCSQTRQMRKQMREAEDFHTYKRLALKLDKTTKREEWKRKDKSRFYDYELVRDVMTQLSHYGTLPGHDELESKCEEPDLSDTHAPPKLQRRRTDSLQQIELTKCYERLLPLPAEEARALMRLVGQVYQKDILGVCNRELYCQTNYGTKDLIVKFVQQLRQATYQIVSSQLPAEEKLSFFSRIKRTIGNCGLCLSGGGSNGYFHFGMIKTLFEHNCLPKIISGASSGSMVASWICVRRDDELAEVLCPSVHRFCNPSDEPVFVKLQRLLTQGTWFDVNNFIEKTKVATRGDTTFLEAYKRTGRILNITTTVGKHFPSALLNYLTSPHVVIWSAVLASCTLPKVLAPLDLMEKTKEGELRPYLMHGRDHRDGSFKTDIPVKLLREMFNVKFFIVSQVNPHVVPFFFKSRGSIGRPSRSKKRGAPLFKNSGMRGGFIGSTLEAFLRFDMVKWLWLMAELDVVPEFFGVDIRYVFLQKVAGDVTLVPHVNFWDYIKIGEDPSYVDMASYQLRGQQATWPCLSRINNQFSLLSGLDDCLEACQSDNGGEQVHNFERPSSREQPVRSPKHRAGRADKWKRKGAREIDVTHPHSL